MKQSNKVKKQKSLWTSTLEDADETALPTDQDIEEAIKHINDNNIDIHKPAPEIEDLVKIFEPKPEK